MQFYKVKILKGKRLFQFDLNTHEFTEIDPKEAEVGFENRMPIYRRIDENNEVLICQALHQKKAAARFLKMIQK